MQSLGPDDPLPYPPVTSPLRKFPADFFQQSFRCANAGGFVEATTFIFDTDVTGVACGEDDFHHPDVVGFGFVAVGIEVVRFGTDGFGEWHEFFNAFVAIVPLVPTDPEVAEVGESTAIGKVNGLHNTSEPGAVAGEAAVVLDDDIQFVGGGEFGESSQSVGGAFLLFFVSAGAAGVDANGVAVEGFGRFDPLIVVFNGLAPTVFVGVAQVAFAVNHDEQSFHADITGAFFEFGEVGGVLRLVLEKLIHVLDGIDAEFIFGSGCKVEVIEFAGEDCAVK